MSTQLKVGCYYLLALDMQVVLKVRETEDGTRN